MSDFTPEQVERAAEASTSDSILSESERLEIDGTPHVFSPDSLSYQIDGWVNDLGIPGNSILQEFGVQEGVYYEDQAVLSEKLQEVTIAWLKEHGYRRVALSAAGAPEKVAPVVDEVELERLIMGLTATDAARVVAAYLRGESK